MTVAADAGFRPAADADYRAPSSQRRLGLRLAVLGLAITSIAFIGNLVALGQSGSARAQTLAWTFGVTTSGFAATKTAIAIILWGILLKLWLRADSLKVALPKLIGIPGPDSTPVGDHQTEFGVVTVAAKAPGPLLMHKLAKKMFRPMLVMGVMIVLAGLVVSFVEAGSVPNVAASAWKQGLQFLGEGMLLSGISFLLGTILWAIRTAGGEIQESLGVKVHVPKMPKSAKGFVGLMMFGLVAEVVQFIGYVSVAGASSVPTAFVWLGPLREFGLGLILAAIAMALAAIANVLGFQFSRVQELIRGGQRSSS